MTSLYLVLGLIAALGFAIWLVARNSQKRGRAEAESEAQRRTIDNANKRTQSDDAIARMDPEQRRRALGDWVSGDDS